MRTIPTTKLWTGYTVLYVQKDVEYRDVINTLSGKGIQDIIYLENQNVPIATSRESPEVALSLSGAEKSQYLKKRSLYFFDKAQNYKIYYIQDKYEKEVSEVIQTLREQNILCGANAHSSYPFLSILICIVFAVLLTFNSQIKLLTGLSMVFPVLLTMSVPFYPVMSCSCLFMYGIFFSLKVWNREGAFNCLIKSRVLPGFASGALLLVLLTSFKGFILFILVIASVLSVSYLAINIKNLMDSKYRVHFVNIRTASVMPLVGKKSTFCMLLCLASLICILLFASFSSIIHPSSKYSGTKGIMLPSASGSGSGLTLDDIPEGEEISVRNVSTSTWQELNEVRVFDDFVVLRFVPTSKLRIVFIPMDEEHKDQYVENILAYWHDNADNIPEGIDKRWLYVLIIIAFVALKYLIRKYA